MQAVHQGMVGCRQPWWGTGRGIEGWWCWVEAEESSQSSQRGSFVPQSEAAPAVGIMNEAALPVWCQSCRLMRMQ